MKKWFKNLYCKIFKIKCCIKCNSMDTLHGYYARGTSTLYDLSSAYGDHGLLCCNCWFIEWDIPLEEHLKTLPKWCKPYKT